MQSHLLLLRVWREDLGNGTVEWRGRLQSLHSGETRHFRDPHTLYQALLRIIDNLNVEVLDAEVLDAENKEKDA